MTCSRAVLMTIGQLSFYDKIKELLLATSYFGDNVVTHFTSSLLAVSFFFSLFYRITIFIPAALFNIPTLSFSFLGSNCDNNDSTC